MPTALLTAEVWHKLRDDHQAIVVPWITPRLERRSRHESHPVDDFLFEYYPISTNKLLNWHPGFGVELEAKEIEAKANSKGAKSYVALNRRSYSSTRLALQKLSEDDAPRLISVLDQQDMCAALESGQPERVVENYIYANSIHLIDYFHIFGRGEIIEISSFQKWNPENPCYVVSSIRFSSGDIGVYQAVWKGPGPWSVSVTNPNVRIEMRPLEKFSIQNKGERKLNEVQIESSETEYKPGLIFQAKQIVNLLDGLPSTLATLKDSMRTMELCSKIYNKE